VAKFIPDHFAFSPQVERQVIERVDRRLWTDTADIRPASSGAPYYGSGGPNGQLLPHSSLLDGPGAGLGPEEAAARERLYQPRADDPAGDWLRRGGSTRTSKYRQRVERARKEFLGGPDPYGKLAFVDNYKL
jgi:hypothetical protein